MASITDCIKAAKTAIAKESGNIARLTERNLQAVDTDYMLKQVRETEYDPTHGENPNYIRYDFSRPADVSYIPMLATGVEAGTIPDTAPGHVGDPIDVTLDKEGRVTIPAETIYGGFNAYGRCLGAKAYETNPVSILQLLEKKAWQPYWMGLRRRLPQFGKESFVRDLKRQVVRLAKRNYTIASGLPFSSSTGGFAGVPTGGLDMAALFRIADKLRREGWNDGAGTPIISGQPGIEIYCGRNAAEFAIFQYKAKMGLSIKTHIWEDDGRIGMSTAYGDIIFVVDHTPTRGYITQHGATDFQFNEILPTKRVAANQAGVVDDTNDDYEAGVVTVGGVNYQVIELAFYIHRKAMERQAMAPLPQLPDGKKFNKNFFNFFVRPLEPWEFSNAATCNKDGFLMALRMTHMYAPFTENPELMGSICFLASPPQVNPVAPATDVAPNLTNTLELAPLTPPGKDPCVACDLSEPDRNPTTPTCSNLFPTDGTGTINLVVTAYAADPNTGGVDIVVERAGGNTGAATVDYATADGTATQPTNYTQTTGTLSWADGEFGNKKITVPLNEVAADNGKAFTLVLSNVTGAALGTLTTATVTLTEP
jgi:hypothetical protein